jgi:hypothetical protein
VLLIALNDGSDYLQIPLTMPADEEADIRMWLVDLAEDALGAALDEAEQAFRAALTPEQATEQLIRFPTAVA